MLNPRRDSGVSPIIGVILLLGIAFALLAILQVVGIPAWNFDVEFDHRQDVQEDMQRLDAGISEVGATGSPRSVVVSLGTRYPNRVILLNPSPPSGTLRTNEGFANVSNAEAVEDSVSDYWNGTRRSFSTRTVAYEPDYNYYDDAPSTVYENGLLFDIEDEPAFLDERSVVDGDTISLITLTGSVSSSQAGATTVSLVPVSTARRTVTVTNSTDDGVSLSLDSRLSADDWRGVLDGEPHVEAVSETDDGVEIELEAGVTYEMRLAEVGLGRTRSVEPAYIVGVSPQVVTAPADGPASLVAEVRDAHNNPVSGAEVEADGDTLTTGSDGRVRFDAEPGTVEMSVNDGEADFETVEFEVRSPAAVSAAGDGAYSTFWQTGDTTVDGEGSVDLTVGTSPVADEARVEYAVNDTSVATVPETGVTEDDGTSEVTATAEGDGTAAVYVSSGGSGDVVNVTFEDVPVGPEFVLSEAEIEIQGGQADAVEFDYELSVSEQVDVTFEILDDTGAVVGSTTHTSDGDGTGNPTVEVTDGDMAAGDRQDFPVTVRGDIDDGELCEVTREEDEAESFDFCTGDTT